MIEDVQKVMLSLIEEKYGNIYRASKNTGAGYAYFRNLKEKPTWSNIFRIAKACGFTASISITL